MVRKYVDFSWQQCGKDYEVIFYINNKPRRFAICAHQNDAETIVDALKGRYPEGFTVYPKSHVPVPQLVDMAKYIDMPTAQQGMTTEVPSLALREEPRAEKPTGAQESMAARNNKQESGE